MSDSHENQHVLSDDELENLFDALDVWPYEHPTDLEGQLGQGDLSLAYEQVMTLTFELDRLYRAYVQRDEDTGRLTDLCGLPTDPAILSKADDRDVTLDDPGEDEGAFSEWGLLFVRDLVAFGLAMRTRLGTGFGVAIRESALALAAGRTTTARVCGAAERVCMAESVLALASEELYLPLSLWPHLRTASALAEKHVEAEESCRSPGRASPFDCWRYHDLAQLNTPAFRHAAASVPVRELRGWFQGRLEGYNVGRVQAEVRLDFARAAALRQQLGRPIRPDAGAGDDGTGQGAPRTSATMECATLDARALATLADHPDWSVKQISELLGCHDKTLYHRDNYPLFRKAWEALAGGGRTNTNRGQPRTSTTTRKR